MAFPYSDQCLRRARESKGGRLLLLRATKEEESCSLDIVTTLCDQWEQSDTESEVDEDLEPGEADEDLLPEEAG